MTRADATKLCHEKLIEHGLKGWHVRINTDLGAPFFGLCSYKDQCIILNAHHIDTHLTEECVETILHEVAHAIVGPGNGHNSVWEAKAREIGCTSAKPCANMALSPAIIDAIRSGATVEVTFDEEIIRRPKYTITRLQDRCPFCNKVAQTKTEKKIETSDASPHDLFFITLECGHTIVKKLPKATPFHLLYDKRNGCEKHVWNKNTCTECGTHKPYQFQIEGMQFAEAALSVNKGAAILDEMGLGKTIQALGVIKFHPELWPVLYVVKSGIKFQWFKQILTWMGDEFVCQIINTSSDIIIPGLRGYIISADMMTPKTKTLKGKNGRPDRVIQVGFDVEKILKSDIKTIVLDECQLYKNPDASRTQQIRKIAKDRTVIALSGTPWKNRGSEFFSVLNMIAPMKFPSYQGFLDNWVDFYWQGQFRKQGGIKHPAKFKEYIKDIAIRRERTEVMSELPLVNRTKLYVKMDLDQDAAYDEAVRIFVEWYESETASMNGMQILAKLARLRHLTGLAKIDTTTDYVDEFLEDTDRKLVVFVHHQDVGQILHNNITKMCAEKYPDVKVLQLTGGLDPLKRFEVQETFNGPGRFVLIASTLAAGEGLNLQTCADCVLHERQWNPANEEQAEGRFIRIGQTATSVNAIYAECADSVDEHLGMIVETKRAQFHKAMNSGEAPKWNESEIIREVADVIVRRYNAKKNRQIAVATA